MREVEVKYRVRDIGALLEALEMRGVEMGAPFCQDDQAYVPDGWAYGDDRRGVPFARLRTVDGRHVFTLKRPAENVLSCEEHETAVADRDQMHHAVVAMGFRPTVRIVKMRRTGSLGDLILCVDELDLQEHAQAVELIHAQDQVAEASGPPRLDDPDGRVEAHRDDRTMHLITVRGNRLMLLA